MRWEDVPFETLYATPSKNGLTRPARVRGNGFKMINMGELFAHERLGNIEMERVPLNEKELATMLVERGDLLFARQSLVLAGAGKCSLVADTDGQTTFESHIIRVRLNKEITCPEFYYYYFKSPVCRIRSIVTQGVQAGIRGNDLKTLLVHVPPISQQRQIASILSAYDDLIENNRRRIQLLEQAARLLYKEWFVHFRFPGHEHVKIIGGVPEGWEKKPLGEVLTLQRGFDLPINKRKEGHFPIYASTGINGYHVEAKVKGPGVVTGRSGSLGTVMYVTGDFWPLNTTLWVKEFKRVGPHYANHLLANMQLEQYNGGAAVPTLNRNDVHRVEVLNPPSMLLRMFEDQSHELVKQIDALTRMNLKLVEARDLLLPRVMNGEEVV